MSFYLDELGHIVYKMLEFLPQTVKNGINRINGKYLYEIRLRAGKPTTVNYGGTFRYLSEYGLTELAEKAIISTLYDIENCIYRAGKYSVYSVEEQIKKGYITAEKGERIGLAGEYVFENGKVLALRNFTSVCIRIPHEIIGCGEEIYRRCMSDRVRNTLIMSSPGLGKTTILRDLSRIIGEKTCKNILICDERGELSSGNTGKSSDVIKFSDKQTAFDAGIRAMRPDVIVTDEVSEQDCIALKKALSAGVSLLASAHFSDFKYVKEEFLEIFERFVLLNEEKIGDIFAVYDQTGRVLSFDD